MKYEFPIAQGVRAISDNGNSIAVIHRGVGSLTFDRVAARQLRNAIDLWLEDNTPPADLDKDAKVAVMLGDGDPPTIIFAISAAAWDYMKDGKSHTMDLTSIGCGLKVMLAGGTTRDQIIADVQAGIESIGGTFSHGTPDRDLGFKPGRTH